MGNPTMELYFAISQRMSIFTKCYVFACVSYVGAAC